MPDPQLGGALASLKEELVKTKTDRTRYLEEQHIREYLVRFQELLKQAPAEDRQLGTQIGDSFSDVLHILSLALLTVGITHSIPSSYSILMTIRPLLVQLVQSPNFTINEMKVLEQRVYTLGEGLHTKGSSIDNECCPELCELVGVRVTECQRLLAMVEVHMDKLGIADQGMYPQIMHTRVELLNAIIDENFDPNAVAAIKDKFQVIEGHLRKHPKSKSARSTPISTPSVTPIRERGDPFKGPVPLGAERRSVCDSPLVAERGLCGAQIEICLRICADFADGPFVVDELKDEYAELQQLEHSLGMFLVTHRWTLRETDLYRYQLRLAQLEKTMGAIAFEHLAEDSFHPTAGYVLPLFLLRKCNALLYKLLDNAEPVAESLTPVYNQLLTTKRCLMEVRDMGGISSPRELYPYQMKLGSLDSLKSDGKFLVEGKLPAGQGILNALLAECFDLVYELELELEERGEESEEVSDA